MEQLYLAEISFYSSESIIYEVCILVTAGAVSDDFSVKEIHQNTYEIPFVVDPDVGQVAYDSGILVL
jgi:hypothetical protein